MLLHLADPHIGQPILEHIARPAVLHPAAGIHIARGQDGQMAVAAVATAIDHAVLVDSIQREYPRLVLVQRPEVVFLVEIGGASGGFIFLELFIAVGQKLAVAQGRDAGVLLPAGGAVAGKGEYVRACGHHRVNDAGHFVDVLAGNRGHDHRADARPVDAADLLQGRVEAARLAEPVVGLAQAVNGQLVLLAAVVLQPLADGIVQVERIAQNREGDAVCFEQLQQLPEIRVQDRVTARDIEIGQTVMHRAEIQTVIEGLLHLGPAHGIQMLAGVFREDVAVPQADAAGVFFAQPNRLESAIRCCLRKLFCGLHCPCF